MKKRILFLADIDSAHTRKWAVSLSDRGYEVGIFSLRKSESGWFWKYPAITVYEKDGFGSGKFKKSSRSKISYLRLLPRLRKVVKEFNPDILHAHYASSYGFIGARVGFKPYVVSVWGSDVYDFPKKTMLHKSIFKYNLKKADLIFSTSEIMATEIRKYSPKKVYITPFGIDTKVFHEMKVEGLFTHEDIVIGTIKSLEKKYGINYLIEAFSILVQKHPQWPLKLLIVGEGDERKNIEELIKTKKLEAQVVLTGKIKQERIPLYHNMLSVYVALSIDNSESFGVATLEAMACGKPVVVSDVDGFKEVVMDNETGIIVPRKNAEAAAIAIEKLITDKEFYQSCADNAVKHVRAKYNWDNNVEEIIGFYNMLVHP
jgi:glycosyltransferase involved in cell wall biosynthesis